jgi:hypothetical protein
MRGLGLEGKKEEKAWGDRTHLFEPLGMLVFRPGFVV